MEVRQSQAAGPSAADSAARLVRALQDGDEAAFVGLVERWTPTMLTVAYGFSCPAGPWPRTSCRKPDFPCSDEADPTRAGQPAGAAAPRAGQTAAGVGGIHERGTHMTRGLEIDCNALVEIVTACAGHLRHRK
ncbi:hypothetical protein FAIPA1_420016 [Frankia sp. AiPs1]